MTAETDYQLSFDATQDRKLLTQEGLVRQLGASLEGLLAKEGDMPSHVTAELIYPDERHVSELQRSIQKLNKVIAPRGFMDRIAHTAFRSMSGIEGDLKPLDIYRTEDPNILLLGLDLSGITRQDLALFADFLNKNAHRLS